ncbi:MAG: cupredoxin domain-containing protein [Gammaproteobacteria bacterium]|nr:MAG: cupredoxin domain-containing protein [Gammaproteobacteria bacterium]RLA44890.1 MAG: cupredoxin domain-containing protein [Gammaproteobacteria bacterium]
MLLINILGLLLIALIVWWFWLYKPSEASIAEDGIVITVENGTYQPSRLKVSAGQPVTLTFLRKDASPCAATVVFPEADVSEELPLNKAKAIVLPAMRKGEYPFTCQMQMYRGTLVVN